MADKRKTFNGDKYERQHNRNLNAIQRKLRKIYESAADEAANIAMLVGALGDDEYFHFDNYPITKQRIRELMQGLGEQTEAVVVNGVRAEWALANDKNDALCAFVLGDKINLSFEEQRKYFRNNNAAREAFLERAEKGMNLSQRVWKYTADYKAEIEAGLSLGLGKGKDARALARELKRNLQNPDKLFRRVRDKYGILRLSKEAKNYHPGQGVYRSSYKNALRLAVTETNMAYRTADYQRYQQFDFIVGVEVHLSKTNHPVPDICDHLQGRYPKDFKFVGWHPFCRCITTSILDLSSDPKQIENTKRIMRGESTSPYESENFVADVPPAFKKWVADNKDRLLYGKSVPYFLSDNPAYAVDAMPSSVQMEFWDKLTAPRIAEPSLPTETQQRTYSPFKMTDNIFNDLKDRRIIQDFGSVEDWESSLANGFNPEKVYNDIQAKVTQLGSNLTRCVVTNRYCDNGEFRVLMGGDGWEIQRAFGREKDGTFTVEHRYFEIEKTLQGKGLSKTVLRTFYEEYRAMGVDKIGVHANIDVGGYTWARYGFQAESRNDVKYAIKWGALNPTQKGYIEKMIDDWYSTRPDDSPFPIKKIADLTYGRTALLGQDWMGTLDLRDAAQRAVFEKYLGI